MPRQGNVISFDDAKRSFAAARRSRSASAQDARSSRGSSNSSRANSRASRADRSGRADFSGRSDRSDRSDRTNRTDRSGRVVGRRQSDYSRMDMDDRVSKQRSVFDRMSMADGLFGFGSSESKQSGRSGRADRADRAERADRASGKSKRAAARGSQRSSRNDFRGDSRNEARGGSRGGSRAAVTSYAPASQDRTEAREEKRRARNKQRADRMFDRQFEGASSSASGEGGSRAALYRGEMGSKQRKANRMQNRDADTSTLSPKRTASTALSAVAGLFSSKIAVVCATVLVGIILTCGLLYPTAKEYYLSIREHDQIQAEYAAVMARNDALTSDVASLSTDEGIKQQAHEEYGLIEKDDETGVLVNAQLESDQTTMDVEASIPKGSVPAPKTWYSDFLDAFFGVS